jgi:hypothetical protein
LCLRAAQHTICGCQVKGWDQKESQNLAYTHIDTLYGNFFMRASQFLIATLKESPSDAVVKSHQLMLRAGMIRKLASGLYTWLPLGLRTLRKVEAIIREEMDEAGALEVLMPIVQPSELWEESGRWFEAVN